MPAHCNFQVIHLKRLDPAWIALVESLPFVKDAKAVENHLVIGLDDPENQNPLIVSRLVEAGAEIQFVGEIRHSLEDVYLQMIHGDGQGSAV